MRLFGGGVPSLISHSSEDAEEHWSALSLEDRHKQTKAVVEKVQSLYIQLASVLFLSLDVFTGDRQSQ